jgi:hypothetical protein
MATFINATTFADPRGKLTVIDKIIPFEIKRIFYIYEATSERGNHSHKINKSALVCVKGKCKVRVNNGKKVAVYDLDNPEKILVLEPEDYRTMYDFSDDAVLLVLASEHFIDDYVDEEPTLL